VPASKEPSCRAPSAAAAISLTRQLISFRVVPGFDYGNGKSYAPEARRVKPSTGRSYRKRAEREMISEKHCLSAPVRKLKALIYGFHDSTPRSYPRNVSDDSIPSCSEDLLQIRSCCPECSLVFLTKVTYSRVSRLALSRCVVVSLLASSDAAFVPCGRT
jgi:hypothetical protein